MTVMQSASDQIAHVTKYLITSQSLKNFENHKGQFEIQDHLAICADTTVTAIIDAQCSDLVKLEGIPSNFLHKTELMQIW